MTLSGRGNSKPYKICRIRLSYLLSRLEAYTHDKLLLKLTSETTLDFENLMSPGNITIFSVPKADLGENLARLVASTIVMKLWFEVLTRARMSKLRTPVFLVML